MLLTVDDAANLLRTTQRYMHLSPAAIEAAIRLLETTSLDRPIASGEIVEAAGK
jgi:hypothetical protein